MIVVCVECSGTKRICDPARLKLYSTTTSPSPTMAVSRLFHLLLTAWITTTQAWPSPHPLKVSIQPVQEVSEVGSLENLAVRYDGSIMVTSTRSSTVHLVSYTNSTPPIAISTIPNLAGLLGIVELERDVFAVAASNVFETSNSSINNGIFKVDLRNFSLVGNGPALSAAPTSPVALLPEAGLLNGICRLSPSDESTILVADSGAGCVFKVDASTGDHAIAIQDPSMAAVQGGLGIGINGVHVYGQHLYYTNLDQRIFARIPISLTTGEAVGPAEMIAEDVIGDDFLISRGGDKAWIASNGQYKLIEVNIGARSSRIAANSTDLEAITAVTYGRRADDKQSLYITGSRTVAANTTVGRVVKLDFSGGEAVTYGGS